MPKIKLSSHFVSHVTCPKGKRKELYLGVSLYRVGNTKVP